MLSDILGLGMRTFFYEKRRLFTLLATFFIILLPNVVFADAINFPIVIGLGLAFLVPITAFVVLVETFVISKYLITRYKETLKFTFTANILSTIAGIPVMISNMWVFEIIIPKDLYNYFKLYLPYSVLGYVLYFIATVLVEFAWGLRWNKKLSFNFGKKIIFYAILLANALTYAVLGPLHYYGSKPIHNIKEFTIDTKWAVKPSTKIIYIDRQNNYLMQIESNGELKEILVPFPMRDYMFSSDLNIFLFRGPDGHLYYYHRKDKQEKKIWDTTDRYLMNRVALSPSGNKVAYLMNTGELKPFRLILFDAEENKTIKTDYITNVEDYDPEIVWSTEEKALYLKENKRPNSNPKIKRIIIDGNIKTVEEISDPSSISLNDYYGRFGSGGWWANDDWGVSHGSDTLKHIKVYADYGLGSHIQISEDDKQILFFADNPGLLHIAGRGLDETSLISSGKECIFEDDRAMYLIDIQNKRIGKIADGQKHVLLTPSYQQKKYFIEQLTQNLQ